MHIAYYKHYEPSNAFVMKVDKDSTSFLCIIVEICNNSLEGYFFYLFYYACMPPKYIIKKIIVQVHPKKSTSTQVIIYHNGEKKMVMVVVVFYTPSRPFKNHNSWTKFINCWPFVVHMDIVFKKNVPLILNFYRRI